MAYNLPTVYDTGLKPDAKQNLTLTRIDWSGPTGARVSEAFVVDPYSGKMYATSDKATMQKRFDLIKQQGDYKIDEYNAEWGGLYNKIMGAADYQPMGYGLRDSFDPNTWGNNLYQNYVNEWNTAFGKLKYDFYTKGLGAEYQSRVAKNEDKASLRQLQIDSMTELMSNALSNPAPSKRTVNTGVTSRADTFGGQVETGLGV